VPGLMEGEPFGPVDLGVRAPLARAGRPLHLEVVALDGGYVEISGHRPGRHPLAPSLDNLAELHPLAGRRWLAQLFGELAGGHRPGILPLFDLALGNRPGPVVAPSPQRPPGVDQEHLGSAGSGPDAEEAGTSSRHRAILTATDRPAPTDSYAAAVPTRAVTRAADELAQRDPVVARLRACYGVPRLGHRTPPGDRFATLVRSIAYQQLAGRAAAAIHGRLVTLLDGQVTAERVLATPNEDLLACGLSRAKVAAIIDLAHHVTSEQVNLAAMGRLPDDEVVAELVKVRGIGRWTAEMFLIASLGRLDVWPVDDLGVRIGYRRAWQLPETPTARELGPLGDGFRPWRTVVAWYCWRSAEQTGPAPAR
jgi:DNA-3-methyladenine glycosylase II